MIKIDVFALQKICILAICIIVIILLHIIKVTHKLAEILENSFRTIKIIFRLKKIKEIIISNQIGYLKKLIITYFEIKKSFEISLERIKFSVKLLLITSS
jgi:hypothetical protein